MPETEFDANEVVAGFPLLSIRHALQWVGLMDDRDDIKSVAESLKCPNSQAERVLETLEERGFVTKTAKKRQWAQTPLGWRLSRTWQPPRRLHPVIERDDQGNATNQGFDTIPCFILRTEGDDDVFEEADLDVGVWTEFESDKLIEINLTQPDDYDHRDSSQIERSVYISVSDAKQFAKSLLEAIEYADKEIARRATAKPKPRPRPREEKRTTKDVEPSKSTSPATAVATGKAHAKVTSQKPKKDPLAATLRELQRRK